MNLEFQNPQVVYGVIGILVFTIAFTVLARTNLGKNRAVNAIVSLVLGLMSVYGLIKYEEKLGLSILSILLILAAIAVFLVLGRAFIRFIRSSY